MFANRSSSSSSSSHEVSSVSHAPLSVPSSSVEEEALGLTEAAAHTEENLEVSDTSSEGSLLATPSGLASVTEPSRPEKLAPSQTLPEVSTPDETDETVQQVSLVTLTTQEEPLQDKEVSLTDVSLSELVSQADTALPELTTASLPSTPVASLPTLETLDQRPTGRVLVVTSGKGGVGKTTTTANIGTGLARLGYSVVMVDTDIGLRNLDILMGLENRIVYNLVDVVEGRCKLHQALVKDKRLPGLMLLPAAQTRDKSAITESQMLDLCHQLKQLYDFILLDCPAGIEQGFQNAISAASEAIVVCTPEMSSVRDADRVIGLLEARETVTQYRLVVNRVRPQLIEANDMMAIEDVLDILAINLLGVIPEDSDIIISTNRGEPVVLDEASMAGQAYRNIARRIAGEDVPLLDLMSKESTWLDKLRHFFSRKKK